jgi:hypothetical protein
MARPLFFSNASSTSASWRAIDSTAAPARCAAGKPKRQPGDPSRRLRSPVKGAEPGVARYNVGPSWDTDAFGQAHGRICALQTEKLGEPLKCRTAGIRIAFEGVGWRRTQAGQCPRPPTRTSRFASGWRLHRSARSISSFVQAPPKASEPVGSGAAVGSPASAGYAGNGVRGECLRQSPPARVAEPRVNALAGRNPPSVPEPW